MFVTSKSSDALGPPVLAVERPDDVGWARIATLDDCDMCAFRRQTDISLGGQLKKTIDEKNVHLQNKKRKKRDKNKNRL